MIKQVEQPFTFPDFARVLFQHRRRAGVYALSFIVLSFNLCLFLQANMHTPAAERTINAIQLACFAVMGMVNVWFFYKRNFLAELALSGARLAFICLLFIVMALVLFIYYYFSGNDGLVMVFASSGAFLFPFLIYQGWMAFMQIPEKTYPVWFIPKEGDRVGAVVSSARNNMQVQLSVARRLSDDHEYVFPVTTSGKLKLGKIFERFVDDQLIHGPHSAIETGNGPQQVFGWQFFETKWSGLYSRYLNPGKSLLENKIKPNATILVKRIAKEP